MADTPEELSLPEAAQRLGLSYQQVYRLALNGSLPVRRAGARWVTTAAQVEHLATNHSVAA